MLRALVILSLCLVGCARYDKETNTMYSLWGARYKDAEEEFETHPPFKDIVNIQGIKTD